MLSNRADIPRARLIFLEIAEELLLAKCTGVSKTGEKKAVQTLLGFTALLSSSYPPLSIHFLQPPLAASELKGLKCWCDTVQRGVRGTRSSRGSKQHGAHKAT